MAQRDISALTAPIKQNSEDWRCPHCDRLLARIRCDQDSHFTIETRCPKCGSTVIREEIAA